MGWESIKEYWVRWAFGIVAAAFALGWGRLTRRIKKTSDEGKALRGGVTALLRDRIIQSCRYHMERGYCSVHERDNILKMVEQYTALGGNGTISDLHDDLRDLPTDKRNARPSKEEEI